jgi:hypothetical protein
MQATGDSVLMSHVVPTHTVMSCRTVLNMLMLIRGHVLPGIFKTATVLQAGKDDDK